MNKTSLVKWTFIILCALLIAGFLFFRHLGTRSAEMVGVLGVTNGQLAVMPETPNAVSSQTDLVDKHVDPLPMLGTPALTKERILQCLKEMGDNTIVEQNNEYIHAVFVTPLMRYHDDVEFYIDPTTNNVQFRSASRIGESDLGANRARYTEFKRLYMQ